MLYVENDRFPFYRFSGLALFPEVNHFVSSGAKDIGFSERMEPQLIRQNRRALAEAVGMDMEKWIIAHQVHSANVAVMTATEVGHGVWDQESRIPDTDALVTADKGVGLMVMSADCVPVLLYDPVKQVIAAVHAGWRGTAARVVVETVKVMQEKFDCRSRDIWAGIGPSIGKCCFEVSREVAQVFQNLFPEGGEVVFAGQKPDKYQIDLWEANRLELVNTGLQPEHIEIAGMCTHCYPGRFFSYRRDGKAAGRFAAGIILK